VYRCKVIDLAAIKTPAVNVITVFEPDPGAIEIFLITGAFMIINYTNSSGTSLGISLGTAASINTNDLIKDFAADPLPSLTSYYFVGLNTAAHNNTGNLLFDSSAMRAAAASVVTIAGATSLPNGFRRLPANTIRVRVSGGNNEPQAGRIRPFLVGIPFQIDD